jgi:acetaldehyde dehydrogenase (acetylating)
MFREKPNNMQRGRSLKRRRERKEHQREMRRTRNEEILAWARMLNANPYMDVRDFTPLMDAITQSVHEMESRIKKYVPGYSVIVGPVLEGGRVTTTIQVVGLGDYLPTYSGNLDIITCASIEIAEEYAKRKLKRGKDE